MENRNKGFLVMSRFTPGRKNAEDVSLNIGDKITYYIDDNKQVTAVIKSELQHHISGPYGYECLFDDDGKMYFADEKGIIGWEGKVN